MAGLRHMPACACGVSCPPAPRLPPNRLVPQQRLALTSKCWIRCFRSATQAAMESAELVSNRTMCSLAPSAPPSWVSCGQESGLLTAATTVSPRSNTSETRRRPMPRDAPVTRTVFVPCTADGHCGGGGSGCGAGIVEAARHGWAGGHPQSSEFGGWREGWLVQERRQAGTHFTAAVCTPIRSLTHHSQLCGTLTVTTVSALEGQPLP